MRPRQAPRRRRPRVRRGPPARGQRRSGRRGAADPRSRPAPPPSAGPRRTEAACTAEMPGRGKAIVPELDPRLANWKGWIRSGGRQDHVRLREHVGHFAAIPAPQSLGARVPGAGNQSPGEEARAGLRIEFVRPGDEILEMQLRPFDRGDDHRRGARGAGRRQLDPLRRAERRGDPLDRREGFRRALARVVAFRDRDTQAIDASRQARERRLQRP